MKTKMNSIKKPSPKLLALGGAMLVATAAFACTKIPMSWFGSGAFNTPQKMGDVRLFLDGATAPALWVHESNYDAQCRTTAYTFNGTTSDGFNFSGSAVPGKSGRRQASIITFTMTVTSIQVSDPITGQVLATDDGGFKIDFVSR